MNQIINAKNYETKVGKQILQEKIRVLKDKARKIIEDIAHARSFGDLSENAEYHEAKKLQNKYSAELEQMTQYMKNLHVVEKNECDETSVSLGATVYLLDCDSGSEKKYKIVGFHESNVDEGWIFYASPLGKALFGRKINDEFEFKPNPNKEFYYRIMKIIYEE
jgi:transcription elongation factor GreA